MRILITGAAGLLGGELAGLLAERGHAVIGLVHRSREIRRNDGAAVPATPWSSGTAPAGQVVTLNGDVRAPLLGLDAPRVGALHGLDVVLHCAAVTGFDLDAETYRRVNEAGTAHAIALARETGARLLHVSTAYVCGERSGAVKENELACGQRFANGYEASKAAAETLVENAMTTGLQAAIARPSIIVGRSSDGAVGAFDNMYAFIRLVSGGLIQVLPIQPTASLDLVPIDHVTACLVAMAERGDAVAGRTLHLASGQPVTLSAIIQLSAAYTQFHVPRLVPAEGFHTDSLSPTEQRVFRQFTSLYANYLCRHPQFDTSDAQRLLGLTCPATDEAFLRRLIDYAVSAGYFKGRRARA